MDQNQRIECGGLVDDKVTPERKAQKPNWLEELLNVKFFKSCVNHQELKKNEANMFCMECVGRICHHCLPRHTLHDTLQVRKYVYQDVVHVRDIQKHIDCSEVQSYCINGSKAVFLNSRPQTKPPKPLGSECITCSRSLQAPYRYCSIACKVSNFPPSPADKKCADVQLEDVTNEADASIGRPVLAIPSDRVKLKKSRRKGIPYRSPLR